MQNPQDLLHSCGNRRLVVKPDLQSESPLSGRAFALMGLAPASPFTLPGRVAVFATQACPNASSTGEGDIAAAGIEAEAGAGAGQDLEGHGVFEFAVGGRGR